MSAAEIVLLCVVVHSIAGMVSGVLVAAGAVIEARQNPLAFSTARKRLELCAQIFLVTLLPVLMWALSWHLNRRRNG